MLIPHNSSAEEALRLTGVARLPFSSAAAGLKPKKRGLGGQPRPYGCAGNGSASPRTGGSRGRAAPAAAKADEPPPSPFSRPAPCREGARARPPVGRRSQPPAEVLRGAVRKAKRSRTAVGRHVGLYGSGGGAPPPSALERLRGGNGGSARLRTRGGGEISLPPLPPPRGE